MEQREKANQASEQPVSRIEEAIPMDFLVKHTSTTCQHPSTTTTQQPPSNVLDNQKRINATTILN